MDSHKKAQEAQKKAAGEESYTFPIDATPPIRFEVAHPTFCAFCAFLWLNAFRLLG
jgi:hypothetical protein